MSESSLPLETLFREQIPIADHHFVELRFAGGIIENQSMPATHNKEIALYTSRRIITDDIDSSSAIWSRTKIHNMILVHPPGNAESIQRIKTAIEHEGEILRRNLTKIESMGLPKFLDRFGTTSKDVLMEKSLAAKSQVIRSSNIGVLVLLDDDLSIQPIADDT